MCVRYKLQYRLKDAVVVTKKNKDAYVLIMQLVSTDSNKNSNIKSWLAWGVGRELATWWPLWACAGGRRGRSTRGSVVRAAQAAHAACAAGIWRHGGRYGRAHEILGAMQPGATLRAGPPRLLLPS